MHHCSIVSLLLMSISMSLANFVDPTDLFSSDERSVELSKKPTRVDSENVLQNPEEGSPMSTPSSSSSLNDHVPENHLKNEAQPREEMLTDTGMNINQDNASFKEDKFTKAALTLFQQFVMSVARLSEGMVGDSVHPVDFCLKLKASQYDLSVLQRFGKGDISSIHNAHDKLLNIIQEVINVPDGSPVFWLENKLGLSSTILILIIAAMLIFFLIMKTMMTVGLTKSIIRLVMLAVFISSVAFTWLEMYQKRKADQERILSDSMKSRCPQFEDLSPWERFSNFFTSSVTFQDENCREFYEAMLINPAVQVSPLEAMAVALVKTFVSPLKIIGEGIKGLITGLFKDMPFQFAMLLIPLVYIIIIITPLMAFGYKIKIPWLLSIEPGAKFKAIHVNKVENHKAVKSREVHGHGEFLERDTDSVVPSSSKPQVSKQLSQQERKSVMEMCKCKPEMPSLCGTKSKTVDVIRNNLSEGNQNVSHFPSTPSSIAEKMQQEKNNKELLHPLDQVSCQEHSHGDGICFHLQHSNISNCEESSTDLVSDHSNTVSQVPPSHENMTVSALEDKFDYCQKFDEKTGEKEITGTNSRGS